MKKLKQIKGQVNNETERFIWGKDVLVYLMGGVAIGRGRKEMQQAAKKTR